jgi:hypothetical protein
MNLDLDPGFVLAPAAGLLRYYLPLSWCVVLLGLLAWLSGSWPKPLRLLALGALAVWCVLPGPYSPDYWLGLAFQMPSLSTVLLCAWLLWVALFPSRQGHSLAQANGAGWHLALAVAAVGLGWLLLLDTLALLPLELYALGFGPGASVFAMGLVLLPWIFGARARLGWPVLALAPLVIVVFAASRLPSGNVWDALLDPWLWLVLQVWLARRIWDRWTRR